MNTGALRHLFGKAREKEVKELDKKFEEGQDILKHLDMSKAGRPEQEQKRVNVDFPLWMVHYLDKESKRLGVSRQSVIKHWIAERLEKTERQR